MGTDSMRRLRCESDGLAYREPYLLSEQDENHDRDHHRQVPTVRCRGGRIVGSLFDYVDCIDNLTLGLISYSFTKMLPGLEFRNILREG